MVSVDMWLADKTAAISALRRERRRKGSDSGGADDEQVRRTHTVHTHMGGTKEAAWTSSW